VRNSAFLGLLIALGIIVFTAWYYQNPPAADEPPPPAGSTNLVLGKPSEQWTLQDLTGKEVRLKDFQDKVVFLNLWATWCGPCLHEMPSIQGLADSLKGDKVAFVLVTREDPAMVAAFVKKRGIKLPVYLFRRSLAEFPTEFKKDGIPATFILNTKGEIVYEHVGASDWNSDQIREFLRNLAKS
jgi:thiol-disulfide isomerase/thioredoxin